MAIKTDVPTMQMFYWIGSYIQINGYPPSIRDIKEGLGYKSTSAVWYVLRRLREEGYIDWVEHKSRTITLQKPL